MKNIKKYFCLIMMTLLIQIGIQSSVFANSFSIPYTPTNSNLMIINAKVNGYKGKFLVDTGASYCVLYKNFTEKNNIKINTPYQVKTRVANNQVVQSQVLKGTVTLGTKKFSDIQLLVIPVDNYDFDGLIGGNLLNKMNYKIDKKKNEILFIIR